MSLTEQAYKARGIHGINAIPGIGHPRAGTALRLTTSAESSLLVMISVLVVRSFDEGYGWFRFWLPTSV
jgi:hypothetical protein